MFSPQKTNLSFLSIPVFLFAFFAALSFVFVVSPAPARASDAVYQWTKTVGGTGLDDIYSMTHDADGNIYVVGQFSTTVDFDPGIGTDNRTSAGGYDAFLSKYDASGTHKWTKTFGGTGDEFSSSVITDAGGNIYIEGYFNNTVDFDPGAGIDNRTVVGGIDAFLSKYDSSGNYQWTKTFGGTANDELRSVAIDSDGNMYIGGRFQNTVDFDPGAGIDNRTSVGGSDAFLSKYDASGNYQWTKTFGGTAEERPYSITIDPNRNVYIGGAFTSSTADFDPGAGTDTHTSVGDYDVFLSKYDDTGAYQWTKTFGGTGQDRTFSIVANSDGNIYVSGIFNNTVDFDPGVGTDNRTTAGDQDVFLSKYDASGNYQWTKTLGGTGADGINFLTADTDGNIYVSGIFNNTVDFDPGAGTDNRTVVGGSDAFLSKYDSSGNYQWTKTFGGTGTDSGYAIATDTYSNRPLSKLPVMHIISYIIAP